MYLKVDIFPILSTCCIIFSMLKILFSLWESANCLVVRKGTYFTLDPRNLLGDTTVKYVNVFFFPGNGLLNI